MDFLHGLSNLTQFSLATDFFHQENSQPRDHQSSAIHLSILRILTFKNRKTFTGQRGFIHRKIIAMNDCAIRIDHFPFFNNTQITNGNFVGWYLPHSGLSNDITIWLVEFFQLFQSFFAPVVLIKRNSGYGNNGPKHKYSFSVITNYQINTGRSNKKNQHRILQNIQQQKIPDISFTVGGNIETMLLPGSFYFRLG